MSRNGNGRTILTARSAQTPPAVADWQARLRVALFEALDEGAIREIVAGLVTKAKAGDIAAARLLLTYAVGSPIVNVKRAVIVQNAGDGQGLAPLPVAPCHALPQTDEKLEVLSERARRGLPLCDPRDASHESNGRKVS